VERALKGLQPSLLEKKKQMVDGKIKVALDQRKTEKDTKEAIFLVLTKAKTEEDSIDVKIANLDKEKDKKKIEELTKEKEKIHSDAKIFTEELAKRSKKEIDDLQKTIDAAEKEIATADFVTALLGDDQTPAAEKEARMNAVGGQFYASTHSVLLADHHLRHVVQANLPGQAAQPVLTASNGNVPVGSAVNTPAARAWANGWGYDGKTSKSQGESLSHKGSGIAVGADVRVADNVAAGAVLAVEDGKVANDKTLYAHTSLKSYSVGSYVSAEAGSVTFAGGLLYSQLDFTSGREMNKLVAGAGEAKASYKGHKTQVFAEVARAFELGQSGTVSPYLNLTHTWLSTDAAKEKGTVLLPLQVKAQNTSALQSTLGVRTRVRLPVATPVSLTANLGWAHNFAKSVKASTRIVTAAGVVSDEMSLKGQAVSKDRALIGVGVEAQVAKNATLALAYDGQFGAKYKDHTGSLQVKVRF